MQFDTDMEKAFPFRSVSDAVEREKSLRKGHPSALHPWPGRQPLAIPKAIAGCIDGKLPVLDPFCGSGMTGFAFREAGLGCMLGDTDPMAVLLSRAAMGFPGRSRRSAIREIPEKVAKLGAEIVARVKNRLAPLYLVGDEPVAGWIWARTVMSPCPEFSDVPVPLMGSFVLSRKKGLWLEPVVDGRSWRFEVRQGTIPEAAKKGLHYRKGGDFQCVLSGMPIEKAYIEREFQAGRGGMKMVAVMLDDTQGHVFRPATEEEEQRALGVRPERIPLGNISLGQAGSLFRRYGMEHWAKLFTPRQVVALETLVDEIVGQKRVGIALKTALMFVVSRAANRNSALGSLDVRAGKECVNKAFQHDEFRMSWDFVEAYPFCGGAGDFMECFREVAEALSICCGEGNARLSVHRVDILEDKLPSSWKKCRIVTEIPVPGLSLPEDVEDFFYAWQREGLRDVWPEDFATMAAPKAQKIRSHEALAEALNRLRRAQAKDFPAVFSFRLERNGATGQSWVSQAKAVLADVLDAGWYPTALWPISKIVRNDDDAGETAVAENERTLTDLVLVARVRKKAKKIVSRSDFRRIASENGKSFVACQIEKNKCLTEDERLALALGASFRCLCEIGGVLRVDGSGAKSDMVVEDAVTATLGWL